jgi:hypothetical protein
MKRMSLVWLPLIFPTFIICYGSMIFHLRVLYLLPTFSGNQGLLVLKCVKFITHCASALSFQYREYKFKRLHKRSHVLSEDAPNSITRTYCSLYSEVKG